MEISINRSEEVARVTLKGHVDERGAETIKSQIGDFAGPGIKEVIFDFREVTRIGSAGIGQLLVVYKNVAVDGGKITVENLSPTLQELFKGLKLNTLFNLID